MKKKILIGVVLLTVIGWGAYSFIISTMISMVKDYDPFTFEFVLQDSVLLEKYGLTTQDHPEDYGFDNVEEVTFYSSLDKLELNGWYVNSSPLSTKTVLIIHGRTSNRLKTMKYLQLFKEIGLDTVYNFFIPDMRNSGKSTPASTYMGYKFAEDLLGGLDYLQETKSQDSFVIYGFSMGAMATSAMLARTDLDEPRDKIEKIIFDSPLADVKGNIQKSAKEMGLPNIIFEKAFEGLSAEMNNYGENMKIGYQLKNVDIPILIIQSNHDKTTPVYLTKAQLETLKDKDNIQTWFMDSLDHVQLYIPELNRKEYTARVASFLRASD